ncbi:MAG: hypothetical protein Q8N53_08955, partial [Longimicrobiales bacterium]|nr:hypothetical protein [Longimicrobiales bacterium]
MRAAALLGLAVLGLHAPHAGAVTVATPAGPRAGGARTGDEAAEIHARARLSEDLASLQEFRPGFAFWRHVFMIPDGEVLFGSAQDGRLLARFPVRGDWLRGARWEDVALAGVLDGSSLDRNVTHRRDQVAKLLEPAVGPVVHNPTRGNFLLSNVPRYGGFLEEWATIYERFGVPAELGLAQAVVESGLSGT